MAAGSVSFDRLTRKRLVQVVQGFLKSDEGGKGRKLAILLIISVLALGGGFVSVETVMGGGNGGIGICRALRAIPEMYRSVVLLRDAEELSTAETATLLEISEANVKQRLHRGRAMLRKLLVGA